MERRIAHLPHANNATVIAMYNPLSGVVICTPGKEPAPDLTHLAHGVILLPKDGRVSRSRR